MFWPCLSFLSGVYKCSVLKGCLSGRGGKFDLPRRLPQLSSRAGCLSAPTALFQLHRGVACGGGAWSHAWSFSFTGTRSGARSCSDKLGKSASQKYVAADCVHRSRGGQRAVVCSE